MKWILILILLSFTAEGQFVVVDKDTLNFSDMTDSAVAAYQIKNFENPTKKGMSLSVFKAYSFERSSMELVGLNGSAIVFYNFWFTYCSPCIA